MSRRNPTLIVGFCTRCHSWTISSNDRDLIRRVDLLRLTRRFLGPFAAFAAASLLWEKCSDPRAVDEVTGTTEGSEQEEVQEYTAKVSDRINIPACVLWDLHLWIKDAGIRFNNADCLIVGLECIRSPFFASDYRRKIELKILRLKVGREAVADAILFTSWNFDLVP